MRPDSSLCVLALAAMIAGPWTSAVAARPLPAVTITVTGRAPQPGEVMTLVVRCSCSVVTASAVAFGHNVPLVRIGNRWQGLLGIDLDIAPGAHAIAVRVERESQPPIASTRTLTIRAKRFPTRHLQVSPEFVNPPPDELQRINHEAAALTTLFENATTPRVWRGPFRTPVEVRANSSFGTRSVFNGEARSPHSGADFPAPAGMPVRAPAAGVVVLAAPQYFTGNTVIIDHGLGLYSVLAHLSVMSVSLGDRVEIGEIVGRVGATGRVTSAHLHWSVRLNGDRVDPLSVVAATSKW